MRLFYDHKSQRSSTSKVSERWPAIGAIRSLDNKSNSIERTFLKYQNNSYNFLTWSYRGLGVYYPSMRAAHSNASSNQNGTFGGGPGTLGETDIDALVQTSSGANDVGWVDGNDKGDETKAHVSTFRNWICGGFDAKHTPEKGRYHLFVSYACPWVSCSIAFPRK